jgi:hypothetical protein
MGRAAWRSVEKRKGRAAGLLRCGGLSASGKKALVDELVVMTGYHRKSVLRA